jgi:hypothetical protein
MAEPRVPGSDETELELACGEVVDVRSLDLGMRELSCDCGADHAVVMDVHPPGRFVPEFLTEVLRETVDTTDEREEFGTVHLMAIVHEEFPDKISHLDVAENGQVGYGLVWVADFASRRLHEIVVELIVELMEHAISHADDTDAMTEFEERMLEFDVGEFVDRYRAERDLETEHDRVL